MLKIDKCSHVLLFMYKKQPALVQYSPSNYLSPDYTYLQNKLFVICCFEIVIREGCPLLYDVALSYYSSLA